MSYTQPSPLRHVPPAHFWRETIITVIMLVCTVAATALFILDSWNRGIFAGGWASDLGHMVFLFVVGFLVYGGLVYQLCRLAYWRRLHQHQPSTIPQLYQFTAAPGRTAPGLTILIPSYKEELPVIEQTLLSAAFQTYQDRHIVLLVDDPANPTAQADQDHLAATHHLVERWQQDFAARRAKFSRQYDSFKAQPPRTTAQLQQAQQRLAASYDEVSGWLEQYLQDHQPQDHAEVFFQTHIINELITRCHQASRQLSQRRLTLAACHQSHRQLINLFAANISLFQRKLYENLAHEPNKAMNLNTYLSLMGRQVVERRRNGQLHLAAGTGPGSRLIPDTPYVITLDADSVLLPDYAATLIMAMEQPQYAHVAVMQTPYSAFPGAPSTFERVAGATTDIQFIIHQGFTGFNATYWVGANALLRKTALKDIAQSDTERGYPVTRYISDWTVIEDTESSIDLVARGWALHNYPERLAYSATPPDYGAFLIQRRRWANGGLLILPKLIAYLFKWPWRPAKIMEGTVRSHYLTSIAVVNLGQLLLILVPLGHGISSFWLPLTAAPYFVLYHRDLRQLGYRNSDLLRVYAINMLLIPVNVGGVIKSLQQAVTRQRIPFGRTPKVADRTSAPAFYHLTTHGLLGYSTFALVSDALRHLWLHAAFSAINVIMFSYVVVRLIGLSATAQDTKAQLGLRTRWRQRFRRPLASDPA